MFCKDTNYKKLIQSSRWGKVRNKYIKSHPTCECCGRLATEVHHRIPLMRYRNDPLRMEMLAFDEDNLISVCHDCHEKLHIELGKNKNKREHSKQLHEEQVKTFWDNYLR